MRYGYTNPTYRVYIRSTSQRDQKAWAEQYESAGTYNYQSNLTDKLETVWRFSIKEDAIVFALKFT